MLHVMGIVNHQSLPSQAQTQAKGLYDAAHEHDACGVGMVVNIHGNKSHELVDNALKVLENMRHRGAEGADGRTGDGAGIMLQIPHEFILLQGIPVPEKGKYGTGLVFLPKDPVRQQRILSIMREEIERVGLSLMHLRTVPTCPECLGEMALAAEPAIKQIFVSDEETADPIEIRLYLMRKAMEKKIAASQIPGKEEFYCVSLSSKKRRGGIGWNIGIGIALSFSYILFMKFSEMFVYTDTLPPGWALWLPNIIFAVIAAVLYRIAPK